MTKHTPGKWEVWEVWGGGLNVREAKSHDFIASCGANGYSMEQMQSNARLIAAAPKLLEALKKVYVRLPEETPSDLKVIEMVKQAIAKAEGK